MALDPSKIKQLKEFCGDDNLARELIEMFERLTPTRIRTMTTSLKTGDLKTLEREAHTLKSSAANLGAFDIQKLCQEIEDLAESANTKLIGPKISEVERLFTHAIQEMKASLQ